MSTNENVESKSWLLAAIIMALVALTMFFVQHFVVQLFDLAVEVSIFYIPTVILVAFYLRRYFLKSSR